MKNSQKGSVALWITIIVVILAASGVFYYSKNKSSSSAELVGDNSNQAVPISDTQPVLQNGSIPAYVFSTNSPSKLTKVTLSHQKIQLSSPWGAETNYKGSTDGSLGQYTFANGTKLTVTLNKLGPQDELKQSGFSATEMAQYNLIFDFVASKIGTNFSSYDYERFLHMTTQQTVDSATSQQDKEGYAKVLVLKNTTSFGSSDTVFSFTNSYGKGFAWVPPNSDMPSAVDFWGTNGWRYTFLIPAKQNITRVEIDALMKSINSNS